MEVSATENIVIVKSEENLMPSPIKSEPNDTFFNVDTSSKVNEEVIKNSDDLTDSWNTADDDELSNDSWWFNDDETSTHESTKEMMKGHEWKCSTCDKELKNHLSFRLHYSEEHQTDPIYKCTKCSRVYTRYKSFVRHLKIHQNPQRFSCDTCGKTFALKKNLQSHMILHTDERRYVCEECGKAFKLYSSLYVHNRCHVPEQDKQKFPCDICAKVFFSRRAKTTHMKTHSGVKNFICDICGKALASKYSLDYHIRSHGDNKPHICKVCDKSFKTYQLLLSHSKVHIETKSHQCDVCGKLFREKYTLKEHYRIHTGSMPYSCEFCGKSFRFRGTLTIHRRLHTGERPYQCKICHRGFTNCGNYNKHLKTKHPPEDENEEILINTSENQQQLWYQPPQVVNLSERPYQCKICCLEFINCANYNTHLKIKHPPEMKMKEDEKEELINANENQQQLWYQPPQMVDQTDVIISRSILPPPPLIPIDSHVFAADPSVQDVVHIDQTLFDHLPVGLPDSVQDLHCIVPSTFKEIVVDFR